MLEGDWKNPDVDTGWGMEEIRIKLPEVAGSCWKIIWMKSMEVDWTLLEEGLTLMEVDQTLLLIVPINVVVGRWTLDIRHSTLLIVLIDAVVVDCSYQ